MFITQISLLGEDYRCWTGIGSLAVCMKEAAALRKVCRGEKFTMMGPGDWQSDNVLIEVYERKPAHSEPGNAWDRGEFLNRLEKLKTKHEFEVQE